MITCSRDFSIEIKIAPSAWWTMESVGANISDATGNSDMALVGGSTGPATAQAGKVNLAATLTTNPEISRYVTSSAATLGFNGADINIFGWTRVDNLGFTNLEQRLQWSDLFNSVALRFNGNGTYDLIRGIVILSGAFPTGIFFFWRWTFDAAAQKWGIAINNGPVTYAAGTQPVLAGNGSMELKFTNGFNPPYFQQCDELCIFTNAMTAQDMADIYNAGAGRTFP